MGDLSSHRLFTQNINVRYSTNTINIFKNNKKDVNLDDMKLKFRTKHPEKNVADIGESKKIVELRKIFPASCKMPVESNPARNLALLQAKLYHTERKLHSARKRMEIKKRAINTEWKDLEEKENQLRQNFIAFNEFVRENNEKRLRATKKIADETQLITRRQGDIDKLVKEVNEMHRLEELMEQNVRAHKVYKTFLEEVVNHSPEFSNINDVMSRFQNLMSAKHILMEKQNMTMDVLENAKVGMMKLIEEKNFVIMGLNNQIANLQARYENANIKALESEELVTEIKNNAVKQLGEIDTVKNSIWNVYVHMASSKKHPIKIKKDKVEEQMMYINRTLTELSKVNKLIKKRSTKIK